MTVVCVSGVMLKREIRCWSLLGVKGLILTGQGSMQVKLKLVWSHPVFIFSVLPAFVQSVEGALVNMTDDVQQTNLYKNCLLLGEMVKIMKSALKRPTGINIGVFVCVCVCA